ncbi:Hypp6122 [Branchiostoma lanceolatum]|uniref:Hypp6122 protein n=1 Tax=Branchiostoma lanceolatum TaxID=7740 RepID=A0A8J9W5X0_BRALA|nr:Hypp6122 [Branchiostoma lanceolatum]
MAASDSDNFEPNDIRPYAFEPEHDSGVLEREDEGDEPAGASAAAGTATQPVAAWDGRDDETEGWRLDPGARDIWCRCNTCEAMATVRECVCCHDLRELTDPVDHNNLDRGGMGVGRDRGQLMCITLHEDFHPLCLMRAALKTALVQRQNLGLQDVREPLSNRILRLSAYRQFTCWVHKRRLGRGVRRVVPACVVRRIREAYPSEDGTYIGFLEADE